MIPAASSGWPCSSFCCVIIPTTCVPLETFYDQVPHVCQTLQLEADVLIAHYADRCLWSLLAVASKERLKSSKLRVAIHCAAFTCFPPNRLPSRVVQKRGAAVHGSPEGKQVSSGVFAARRGETAAREAAEPCRGNCRNSGCSRPRRRIATCWKAMSAASK